MIAGSVEPTTQRTTVRPVRRTLRLAREGSENIGLS